MTTLVNNITSLHSKFSIFRNSNETVYSWTDILLSLDNNSKFNDIYYNVFNSNLNKTFNITNLIDQFRNFISNKSDIYELNDILNKLFIYTSCLSNNVIEINDELYQEVINKLLKNNINDIAFKNLLENRDKNKSFFTILGNILTFGKTKKYSLYYLNCIDNIINNLNDHLNNVDIIDVFKIIENIGNYLDIYFFEDSSNYIYKECYSKWINNLIDQLSEENINEYIKLLKNIEKYIGNDKLSINIGNKLLSTFNNFNEYLDIVNNTSILFNILEAWSFNKYPELYKLIIDKMDNILTKDVINNYNISFKNLLLEMCNRKDYQYGQLVKELCNKKYINSFLFFFNLGQYDIHLLKYIEQLENRYINLISENINNAKEMYLIDLMILENINNYCKQFDKFKHIQNNINKLRSILSDVDTTFKTNNEIKNVNVIFDSNSPTKYFNDTNVKYILTSGSTNWLNLTDHIINHYDIKYNKELDKMVKSYNEFYKQKCSHRTLKWLNNLSTVIMDYNINNTIYKLKLSVSQANILLMFNDKDRINYDVIYDNIAITKTDLINKSINNIVDSLVNAKILIKENDDYLINNSLKLPKQYTTTPANIKKYTNIDSIISKKVNKKVNQDISYDRINTMKCYLVKIGKNNKNKIFTKDQLFDLLQNNIKIFKFDLIEFNKVLETIVKSYYFEIINDGYKFINE